MSNLQQTLELYQSAPISPFGLSLAAFTAGFVLLFVALLVQKFNPHVCGKKPSWSRNPLTYFRGGIVIGVGIPMLIGLEEPLTSTGLVQPSSGTVMAATEDALVDKYNISAIDATVSYRMGDAASYRGGVTIDYQDWVEDALSDSGAQTVVELDDGSTYVYTVRIGRGDQIVEMLTPSVGKPAPASLQN